MDSSMSSCLNSPYLLFEIGQFLSLKDNVNLTRVNKVWQDALLRVGRKRKSLSLTPFLEGFHVQDSLVASIFQITREDLIGNWFYSLYAEEATGHKTYYLELEEKITSCFTNLCNFSPNIEYIQVMWLTDLMLQNIATSFPRLRGLAFHEADNSISFQSKEVKRLSSSLHVIAFGLGSSGDFVSKTLPHLPLVRQLVFMSTTARDSEHSIEFQCLRGVGKDVREIYFGTRRLELLEGPDTATLPGVISTTNLKNVTLLEILNPKVSNLNSFVDVLSTFTNLTDLSIYLPDTSSLTSGDAELKFRWPCLTHLTVIVDSFLSFDRMFGERKGLKSLIMSACLQEPDDERGHIVDFDLKNIESTISNIPNVEFLCISSFEMQLPEKERLLLDYVSMLCKKATKLRAIHLPHSESVTDREILRILEAGMPDLKRVEFIGTVNKEVENDVLQWMRGRRLRVKYQDSKMYCMCPYLRSQRRF